MVERLKNRLKRLEMVSEGSYPEILHLIEIGAFYDEISDTQKTDYCKYSGIDRDAFEAVRLFIGNDLHIKLEKRPPKMTPEEEKSHISQVMREIEEYMKAL